MDQMDIDNIVDVPDTPERLTTLVANGKSFREKKHHSPPTPYHLVQKDAFEGCSKDKPIFVESGSKRPSLRHPKPIGSSCNSKDRTAFSLPNSPLLRKGEVPGTSQVDFRKRPGLVNGASGSANREGSEFVTIVQNKPGGVFISRDPIASRPVNKQKRLVRNGCISPNNIAKAKQSVVKDTSNSLPSEDIGGLTASSSPSALVDISDLVAEVDDSHTRKGKGILTEPFSCREPELRNRNLHIRSSMNYDEKAVGKGDFIKVAGKSTGESGGWRTTRHRSREMDVSSPSVVRETGAARCSTSSRHLGDKMERKGKELSLVSGNDYSENPDDPISSVNVCTKESVSYPKAHLGHPNGHSSATNTHIKRKKQGSTSSNFSECSTPVSNDFEVTVLSSTARAAANPRASSSGMDRLQTIIEVDELSPLSTRNTHNEDAKARQVEADELLARELQEQFYNEAPVRGVGEVDEYIALALQHDYVSDQGSPRARHPMSRARASVVSELRRQSQSRTSSSAPRRGSLARASTFGRMARIRSRVPGQPRTLLSSRGRTSMFPADMDIEVRMHILGALEEFSDMGLTSGILQTRRDFTEDDYEMLLALDENNNLHSGASNSQINGLPQSTVQSDNFEETCAVCLETPTIGDTIRHLPCLHKFHKDCIDPWLRRRTSCPICKSSIT